MLSLAWMYFPMQYRFYRNRARYVSLGTSWTGDYRTLLSLPYGFMCQNRVRFHDSAEIDRRGIVSTGSLKLIFYCAPEYTVHSPNQGSRSLSLSGQEDHGKTLHSRGRLSHCSPGPTQSDSPSYGDSFSMNCRGVNIVKSPATDQQGVESVVAVAAVVAVVAAAVVAVAVVVVVIVIRDSRVSPSWIETIPPAGITCDPPGCSARGKG